MKTMIAASLLAVVSLSSVARAAEQQQSQTPEQQDAERRKKLEEEIAKELGAGKSPAQPQPASGQQAPAGGNPMARLLLLPDISAVASFALAYDNYDVEALSPREGLFGPEDKPQFLFEEVELGLQSVIDPYARADVFVSFTPDGAEVEEAYLTTLSLPASLQVRAGQFFSPFGRQNQQHPHVWEFVDAPLARGRLLADEVLSGPGVDVGWLAPLPWFAELRLAGQSTAPTEEDTQRLTGFARLLQYFPLGEATTLGVGLSAARRDEGPGGALRDLGALDVYLRWRPPQSRSFLTLQGELYGRKFRHTEGGSDTAGYAQAFWRQGAYFGYGVRYDNAPSSGDAEPGAEHRYSALAIWLPSEFQRIRLQVSYDRLPGGQEGLEALLALEFGIGSHAAHPF
jgi:hypothetical protein